MQNARNITMMGGKRLPYDAEIEYLESTGDQYINTGIIGGSSSKVEISASSSNTAQNMGLFGSRNVSFVKAFTIWQRVTNTSVRFDFTDDTANRVIANAAWDTSGVNTVVKDGPNNTLNGVAGANNATATFTCEYPFYLFSINTSGTATSNASARVYSCKIWQNGVLVRDFIPVRKGTVGYLYDRVSGKLFGNAGTGDFVIGQDVVPVEYIESHGTEYIPLDDIHPNYYTYKYTELDYQLTKIESGLVQQTGASSLAATLCTGGGYVESVNTGIPADLDPHRIVFDGMTSPYHVSYDGTSIKTFNRSTNSARVFTLFGVDQSGTFVPSCHMKLTRMTIRSAQNGTIEHDYRPVRVGTDATSWEGAMMDVLTRRIYRNAGTGAFTYGNDLKYGVLNLNWGGHPKCVKHSHRRSSRPSMRFWHAAHLLRTWKEAA